MSGANTLFLRLEGPFQSWGERAQWAVRDTAHEPTKSGVVGLLCCALGLSADYDIRAISRLVHMGVRCDRPGVSLIDYHTVVGGVLSAEGKVKVNANTKEPETVVSWRYYLCDASFLVAVQSQSDLIDRLANAVNNPIWPIYLGRKSCPPARPVYEGVGQFGDLKSALAAQPLYLRQPSGMVSIRTVLETTPGEGVRRRDEINSNQMRTFLPRYTVEMPMLVENQAEEL